MDSTVGAVLVHGSRHVAIAELFKSDSLPHVCLATVHGQPGDGHGAAGGERSETSTRSHFGELVMIADEDHACAVGDRPAGERFQLTGASHRGFVDHEHGVGVGELVAT